MLNIFTTLFELDLINERTKENTKAMKACGEKLGRSIKSEKKINSGIQEYSVKEIIEVMRLSVSRN